MSKEDLEICVDLIKTVWNSSLFGIIVGIAITTAGNFLWERSKRKHEYISRQITNLYGQLYYFASLNAKIYELHEKIHKAYLEEYCDKKQGRKDSIENTIQILNSYSQKIKENNAISDGILRDNFAYIDIKDRDKLLGFTIHHIRYELEYDESVLKTPIEIYEKIGEIKLYNEDFVKFLEDKMKKLRSKQ